MLLSRGWPCPPPKTVGWAGPRADEVFASSPRVSGHRALPWGARCTSSAAAVAMGQALDVASAWRGKGHCLSAAGWGSLCARLRAASCLVGSCLMYLVGPATPHQIRALATAPSSLPRVALGLTGHHVLGRKSSSHNCSERRTSARNGEHSAQAEGPRSTVGGCVHREHCVGAEGLVRP